MRNAVAADRAEGTRELASRGVGALLAGIPGVLGWDGHVLRLRLLLAPLSTSELAQHLGTSVGNASKHATVLRDAGLVTSVRQGCAVRHATTPFGVALLTGRT